MQEPKIRDRLVGGWRLTGYEVNAGGKTDHPLGDDPLGTILYTLDGYMSAQLAGPGPYKNDDLPDAYCIAYSGPYDADDASQTLAHHGCSDELQPGMIAGSSGVLQVVR